MAITLSKAGFNVLPSIDCPADDDDFKRKSAEEMDKCVCSLHMLSGEFGRRFETDDEISFPQYQFLEAKKRISTSGSDFNVFVWLDPENSRTVKPVQQNFIKYIRNNITRNMMFSNSMGPMQMVDDIRVVMMKQDTMVYDSKDTDIFFIFNQQDEQDAQQAAVARTGCRGQHGISAGPSSPGLRPWSPGRWGGSVRRRQPGSHRPWWAPP